MYYLYLTNIFPDWFPGYEKIDTTKVIKFKNICDDFDLLTKTFVCKLTDENPELPEYQNAISSGW